MNVVAMVFGNIGVRLEYADRAGRVGETAGESHARGPMIPIRETERSDSGARETFAGRDDVRLVGVAAEAVQHRGASDGARIR